jgi:ABC-type uncharacterized transport system substrate-binding protein
LLRTKTTSVLSEKIPVRIHVNGTRGKSSIARLLAAGLRQSALKVICKTTGSEAKLVLDDKNELPILRGATANAINSQLIIQQRRSFCLGRFAPTNFARCHIRLT